MGRKEDALGACDHVAYEIKMFLFCITNFIVNPSEGNSHNALLESFAVHFRNIYYFFGKTKNKRYKDDTAVYYADIKNVIYPMNTNIEYEKDNADKKIAHIDRNRSELKQDGWDFSKLYSEFRTPIIEFINDSEILLFITETGLLSEIKSYCNAIDCILDDSATKGLVMNKVDTTSGSISNTSTTLQG